jgi:hypothetical protein
VLSVLLRFTAFDYPFGILNFSYIKLSGVLITGDCNVWSYKLTLGAVCPSSLTDKKCNRLHKMSVIHLQCHLSLFWYLFLIGYSAKYICILYAYVCYWITDLIFHRERSLNVGTEGRCCFIFLSFLLHFLFFKQFYRHSFLVLCFDVGSNSGWKSNVQLSSTSIYIVGGHVVHCCINVFCIYGRKLVSNTNNTSHDVCVV